MLGYLIFYTITWFPDLLLLSLGYLIFYTITWLPDLLLCDVCHLLLLLAPAHLLQRAHHRLNSTEVLLQYPSANKNLVWSCIFKVLVRLLMKGDKLSNHNVPLINCLRRFFDDNTDKYTKI